ncbi:MAG: hypothetical protein ICV59_09145 [Thermoleophilia bacterium]|nr:hypothetical protein [Thermoleophilia bacterium]
MLERNDCLGGAIKTAEITEPGYLHDVFSTAHPLRVGGAAHARLAGKLAARGLEYLNTDVPAATVYPDGENAFLLRSADANAAEFDDDFLPNADLAFGVLGTELWSADGARLAARAYRRLGRRDTAAFVGRLLTSARDWLTETFQAPRFAVCSRPGAPHRPGTGRRRIGLPDPGDRRRGAGGRHADAARGLRPPRQRSRPARPRSRRLPGDAAGGRARARPRRAGIWRDGVGR